jgi:hypothetical protein
VGIENPPLAGHPEVLVEGFTAGLGRKRRHIGPRSGTGALELEAIQVRDSVCNHFAAVRALTGTSMSSLRMTRLVAFRVASSKPWPWVMASVGQASTQ